MKALCAILTAFFFSVTASGQQQRPESRDSAYVSPLVTGLPRPKVITFKYEFVPHYQMTSIAKKPGFRNATNEVRQNGRVDARIKFPIIYKKGFTTVMGLKFFNEEFHFEKLVVPLNKSFNTFEDRSLKSVGSSLLFVKTTRHKKYYVLNLDFDFNGDFNHSSYKLTDFLKFSVTPLTGWKIRDDLSYAAGVSYSYTFGAPMLYPVISYNRNFNKHWGLETLLPAYAKMRYSPNEKVFFYSTIGISGAAYRLNNKMDSVFRKYNNLHLHRSEIKLSLSVEREIHDWLWFSIEAGFCHNLRFNVTNSRRAGKDVILTNKLNDGIVAGASIFVVPPRSLLKKLKK